jgi:D-alanine--poly(phosphoribitol) ligase subunit 2
MSDVEQSILDHIRTAAAGTNVKVERDTGLLEAGLLDSISLVGLIQFLEEKFGVRIPDSDIGAELFASPGTIISYVEARLGITAAPKVTETV